MSMINMGVKSNADFNSEGELPSDFSVPTIKSWLTQLPMVHTAKASRLLLTWLQVTNKADINATQRFEILECLRPTLWVLLAALDAQFTDKDLPLDERSKTFAQLCLDCLSAFAHGYQLVSDAPQFSKKQTFNPTRQSTVLYRFLHAHGAVLIRTANLYEEPSTQFWSAAYQIFQLAESMGLVDECVEDVESDVLGKTTIAVVFKTMLLFFLTNPYKCPQRSHYQIYRLIAQFAKLCDLENTAINEGRKALFFIDLKTSDAPRPVQFANLKTVQNPLFLYTRGMAEAIVSKTQSISSANASDLTSPLPGHALVYHVVRSLGVPQRRKAMRVSENNQVRLAVGIPRIVNTILEHNARKSGSHDKQSNMGEVQSQSKRNNANSYGGEKLSQVESEPLFATIPTYQLVPIEDDFGLIDNSARRNKTRNANNVWRNETRNADTFINQFANESQSQVAHEDIWNTSTGFSSHCNAKVISRENQDTLGQLVDSSITGYQLMWTKPGTVKPKISELIGLQWENNRLELGVIRWIRSSTDKLSVGIQLLSHEVDVACVLSRSKAVQQVYALVFEDGSDAKSTVGIVLQSLKYKSGDRINMLVGGRQIKCRLDTLEESTGNYSRFIASKLPCTNAIPAYEKLNNGSLRPELSLSTLNESKKK